MCFCVYTFSACTVFCLSLLSCSVLCAVRVIEDISVCAHAALQCWAVPSLPLHPIHSRPIASWCFYSNCVLHVCTAVQSPHSKALTVCLYSLGHLSLPLTGEATLKGYSKGFRKTHQCSSTCEMWRRAKVLLQLIAFYLLIEEAQLHPLFCTRGSPYYCTLQLIPLPLCSTSLRGNKTGFNSTTIT